MKTTRIVGFAALVAIVAAFPLFAGNYPVKLLQEILIWGIFAMSLDLLMGYAGMVSFGHSAFFGLGLYGAAAALLVMHSPTDNTVGIANASEIFRAARHPRSFVSLEGADHLLTGRDQAKRAARIISAWADPYLT